ncbi:hypothetical protein PR202_gb18069 [Eleusine coracana subsp. coracana]|uniref:Uncharacterized protein n=1 Tax=Eleusine coracana subsp. coracana TaxID=191504 RepID=A0AAV5F4A0_ELECO|nr:hypothetical protein QOZ80_6BG0459610 [Eleusine coracana subsp. coracana]GJN29751.1 hypothetical protein PR202_gb18002 [Eleusine coracana subsp. coracana]GJN29814.1 hypothetical protein PR202_gb18069 [Eleusine coracana subsp. coracana]
MDKVLAFSILSASPADIAAGVGGSWTRLSWRRSAEHQAAADQLAKANKEEAQDSPRSHGGDRTPSNHAPRFAPEFDGIDCFETIVTH